MKNNLLGWLCMVAMLVGTGCSTDEVVNDYSPENAIQFGTYVGRDADGRASVFETSDLKVANAGFGVYAYYTGKSDWDYYKLINTQLPDPNFMNNTHVTYSDGAWSYFPLKYWPNNVNDKVHFFAYAPYSKNNNIVANNDAKISFTVPNDVTAQTDLTAAVEPQLNQSKGELGQVVTFNFKHLLSRIEFTLQAAADQVSAGGTINNGTTITLNEIRIGDAGGSGFYNSGVYSTLDNTWSEVGGNQSFVLNSNNFVSGTNVLNNSKNSQQTLIGSDSNDYIMVIPQTIRQLPIYVNYTVKTEGQNDEGEWDNSIVTNERTTYVKEMIFSPNHIYKFHIVLGMSTVEVSATVGDWKGGHNEIVNLPKNN